MRHRSRNSPPVAALGLAVVLILSGCSGVPGTNQQAACAGPGVEAHPARVAPGGSFDLEGGGFFTGCEDVIVDGEPVEESHPREEIEITLRQGSREWRLAVVDAREDYSFATELRVPEGVQAGDATVTAAGARTPLRVTGV